MNTKVKMTPDLASVNIDVVETTASLKDIIDEYKVIAIKLSLFADVVPETRIEQTAQIEKETRLLDDQAALLETALSRPVNSLDDAKAVLTLWHHEVVQSQSPDSLSPADELVNSVLDFLNAT